MRAGFEEANAEPNACSTHRSSWMLLLLSSLEPITAHQYSVMFSRSLISSSRQQLPARSSRIAAFNIRAYSVSIIPIDSKQDWIG